MTRFRSLSSFLLPLLVLMLEIASIAPLLALVASGLDADDKVGSPFIPAMLPVAIVGFWFVRRMSRGNASESSMQVGVLAIGIGLAVLAPWITGLGPLWDASVLGISILAAVQVLLAWWRGVYYASHAEAFSAEELSGIVQRSWLVLAGCLVLIPILDGIDSDPAIDTAGIALPVAAVSALVVLALGQMQRASKRSREVGGNAPNRRRWLTFTGVFAVIVVAIAMLISAAIGDDTSRTLLTPFALALDGIAFVLSYIFLGIAIVFLVLFYPFLWLIERFQRNDKEQQQSPQSMGDRVNDLRNGSDGGGFPDWLRLTAEIGAVVLVVAIVAFIIVRTLKKQRVVEDDDGVEEEHESLWSRDLAMAQLKGLFRRRHHEAIETIDLRKTPGSVREAYRALLALAQRDGVPRRDDETPAEFAARLRGVWPNLASDVAGLTREYELAKYGDLRDVSGDDRARGYWAEIWAVRREPSLRPSATPLPLR